jgi:cysteine desulfurase/selenocysteine lyase
MGQGSGATLAASVELEARRLFPGAEQKVQLDAAGISIISTAAQAAVEAFLSEAGYDAGGAHHGANSLETARRAAAELIGAHPQEIALIPSTSAGLNIIAGAIDVGSGDTIVTSDLEFVSIIAPFQQRCRESGAALEVARTEAGRVPAERIIERIDSRTRAVVLSSVVWTNGYRVDLGSIGRECRRLGIPLVVDGIQQLGAIPLDVTESCVDVLICGGHKWLGSPSGMGFLYASEAFCERHPPKLPYAPTALPSDENWLELWQNPDFTPLREYPHPAGAQRFEIGCHHAAMSASGLAAAIGVFQSLGPQAVRDHVLGLGTLVANGLAELGLDVVTPLEVEHRSGITAFHAGASADDDIELVKYLREEGIITSVRYTAGIGGARVSCHVYNNADDVDKLLSAVRKRLGK